jgi:PAS domain S-box-containing protein
MSPADWYAAIVHQAGDAVISKTLSGVILTWNDAAERMYGHRAAEAVGKPIAMLVPPNRADELPSLIEKLVRGESAEHFETSRIRRDGVVIDVSITVSPIHDAKGRVVGITTITRDITQQKWASQYARSLIEASLDPLVTISAPGKITDVNEATVRVTGMRRQELIGTDFSDYFTEPEKAREGYQAVFAKGFVSDYPLTIHHQDGGLTDVLYNASVYKDSHGNVLGVFAAARDVTAQKQAEREVAERREKELMRLAELEKFQRLTVGRELKMIELKREIEDLRRRLGEPG